MIDETRVETAKLLAKIYRLPRRAYVDGPWLPVVAQDEIIAEALELYVQENSW